MCIIFVGVNSGVEYLQVHLLAKIGPGIPLRKGNVFGNSAINPGCQRYHNQAVCDEQQDRHCQRLAPRHTAAQHHVFSDIHGRIQVSDQDQKGQKGQFYQ